jgi:hypothetical protein
VNIVDRLSWYMVKDITRPERTGAGKRWQNTAQHQNTAMCELVLIELVHSINFIHFSAGSEATEESDYRHDLSLGVFTSIHNRNDSHLDFETDVSTLII